MYIPGLRLAKQLIFGSGFLLFIILIGVSIYLYRAPEPVCTDGIQNGEEEGVDCGFQACGFSCPPEILDLEILSTQAFKISDNEYDAFVRILNPNSVMGASNVVFEFTLKDSSGEPVGTRTSNFYILPGQTKYVIETAISTTGPVSSIDVKIKEAQWERLDPLGKVNFPLRNYEALINNDKSEVRGVIINQSDFDFDTVDIRVVLFDEQNEIIGVNTTTVRTLLAGTERHFVAVWPEKFNFSKIRLDVESDTNLFINSNYIRRYGSPTERFQKYY